MNRKQLEKRLDWAWSHFGKEYAECEICKTLPFGSFTPIQAHHIIYRTHQITRWDLRNRLWVCPQHHISGMVNVHDNSLGWFWGDDKDWMGLYRPDDKEYLEKMKQIEFKKWALEELEGLLSSFKS